jgi:hypothetical protein
MPVLDLYDAWAVPIFFVIALLIESKRKIFLGLGSGVFMIDGSA